MKNIKNKGFTLIELLVVIAIIGILSSIALVSLNTTTNKAKDTAIKAQLSELRASAAVYNDDYKTYEGFCTSSEATRILKGVKDQYPTNVANNRVGCKAMELEWAACGWLLSTTTAAWCVDGSGNTKAISVSTCVPDLDITVCP